MILLVDAMLGLMPLAPRNTLVVDPALPEWLPDVTMSNITVGKTRASLRFRRDPSGHVDVEVLSDGGLVIIRPDLSHLARGEDRTTAAFLIALDPGPSAVLTGKK